MTIETEILQVLHYHPLVNRVEIASMLLNAPSDSTMKKTYYRGGEKGIDCGTWTWSCNQIHPFATGTCYDAT